MSLISGAIGEKVQMPDGAQVDHLSENTVGHGMRVRGVSTPVATPVADGDVGEVQATTYVGGISGSTTLGTYTSMVTLSLTAGRWRIVGALPVVNVSGTSGDTGGTSQGVIVGLRIQNTTDATTVVNAWLPGMAKSTVNAGYLVTSGTVESVIDIIASKTFSLDFAASANSGSPAITGLAGNSSGTTVVLRAVRIA